MIIRRIGLVLGYDASSSKSIAFYHKNGQIGDSIKYKRFKKIVRKIDQIP